ncbi:carbohydrate binding domain-containing protein [Sorangium sp. So ce269]
MERTITFIQCVGVCASAVFWLGCAQIFGFDKRYELRDASAGGAGAGGAGAGGAGAGGAGAGGAGAGGADTAGAGAGDAGPGCADGMPPVDITALSLIDDMEDGNRFILPGGHDENPRHGRWFVYNDGRGTQTPSDEEFSPAEIERPRDDSSRAVHTAGDDGFVEWGAGVGFSLAYSGFYDAAEFRGIAFWAYAEEGSTRTMSVAVGDAQTTEEGGICNEACGDHFFAMVVLSRCWKYHEIPFSELQQIGWGEPAEALDAARLWGVQLSLPPGQAFDVWIDDIAFYR